MEKQKPRKQNISQRFDEIMHKDIKLKISEAFLELETSMRVNDMCTRPLTKNSVKYIGKKADQLKEELAQYIDAQMVRIADAADMFIQTENLHEEK